MPDELEPRRPGELSELELNRLRARPREAEVVNPLPVIEFAGKTLADEIARAEAILARGHVPGLRKALAEMRSLRNRLRAQWAYFTKLAEKRKDWRQ